MRSKHLETFPKNKHVQSSKVARNSLKTRSRRLEMVSRRLEEPAHRGDSLNTLSRRKRLDGVLSESPWCTGYLILHLQLR